jgi:hypothetical protein
LPGVEDVQDRRERDSVVSTPPFAAFAIRPDRTVYPGQVTRPALRALARKGYGRINYQPCLGRRRVVESLTLNDRGLTAIAD